VVPDRSGGFGPLFAVPNPPSAQRVSLGMSVCSRLGQDLLRHMPQPTVSDVIQKTAGRIARSDANVGIVRVEGFAKPSGLQIFCEFSLFHEKTVSQPEEIAKAIFSITVSLPAQTTANCER
jgi:hypothetical protein